MATTTRTAPKPAPQPEVSKGEVAIIAPPRMLPPSEETLKRYDVSTDGWRTLVEAIFPAAKTPAAVVMALEYCARRKLDIFKHPVHIVPIWNSQAGSDGRGAYVETVWPGIAELRTTAARTKEYAGMDAPVFGPVQREVFTGKVKKWKNGQSFWEDETVEVEFPAWCQITVYRLMAGNRVPFPGPRVLWLEAYASKGNSSIPNEMWAKRPHGQLEKCAEAAALRRAFPEELGSDYAIDEIGAFHTHEARDVTLEGDATTAPPEPKPSDFQPSADASVSSKQADSVATGDKTAVTEAGGGDRKPEASSAGEPEATAGRITDVSDLNDEPVGLDDPVPPAEDWPLEHAKPGQKLTFTKFSKFSEFMEFAEDFCPKTNPLGAEQFLAFYQQILDTMAKGHAKQREAAGWVRAVCAEVITPPDSVKR